MPNPSQKMGLSSPRAIYDGAMLPDVAVRVFSHYDQVFPSGRVAAGGRPAPLPRGRPLETLRFRSKDKEYDLIDYLTLNRVAGLLILQRGRIIREDYQLGINDKTRWAAFSVTKSVASTLVGMALKDGAIRSLDDPLSRYVPALDRGAYSSVSVRQLLQMTSGVRWDETYTNPLSDRRRLLDSQLTLQPGNVLRFMNALPRIHPPGQVWNYNTGETGLVGLLVEEAVGMPVTTYLSRKLWVPLGMESDATWQLDSPGGTAFTGSGLSATLRDLGRFGLFALRKGEHQGRWLVPEDWFDQAGSSKVVAGKTVDYGYMWWPSSPAADPLLRGSYAAIGIFGQFVCVHPALDLVVVVLSARSKPTGVSGIPDGDFFTAVARAMA